MANYVIEGTVSELTKEGTKISVKIVGTEGYAIKQGDKTYNVFCPKDLSEAGNCSNGYIVDSENEFTVDNSFENILIQASWAAYRCAAPRRKIPPAGPVRQTTPGCPR